MTQRMLKVCLVMMTICFLLVSPPLSGAQTDVTLSVSEGAGVRGSYCCNPNYPEANRVAISLDNPSDRVGILQVDICSPDLGDELILSGYQFSPRVPSNMNKSITYNSVSQCVQVRFSWTQPYGSVYIAEGSGTIATLDFDVSQAAPHGNCPAGGDLSMSGVNVLDEWAGALTVTPDPGKFCYYKCGSNRHCDDGLFCNGEEVCFNNAWCMDSFSGDPCSPLLCNETTDKCYCTEDDQCNDGLWCNGIETCTVATGTCKVTASCANDNDPCTDNCDEGSQSCTYECNADGPWDACCQTSATCSAAPVCNEEVTLTVGNGSGQRSSTGREVVVSMANPDDRVRAVQLEICDVDNYLTVQASCFPSVRVPAGKYACQCNEMVSGCATCSLTPNFGVYENIPKGSGSLFTVKYNVSGSAPFGQCRDLAVNTEGSLLVLSGKVCSAGSSSPGTDCTFDADCPGGTCIPSYDMVTMPVDGEFCFPCTIDDACFDGNPCTTDTCVSGLCQYTNLTGSCNDGDPCTTNDQCRKADIGTKNQCVGIDAYPDDGYFCNGLEACDGGTDNPCAGSCDEGDDVCVGSDVTLTVENAYGREGVIPITLENSLDEVGEVQLTVCDIDQRSWLHISAIGCNAASRAAGFNCITSDVGGGCVGVTVISSFPLDSISAGSGPIAYLSYTVDPVTIPMANYADLEPQSPDVRDYPAGASLSVTPKPGRLYAVEYCEGDFDGDTDVDAQDIAAFLDHFGRSLWSNPCTDLNPCNGDFDCDTDVDAADLAVMIEDFGRSLWSNPCPPLSGQFTCSY